MAVGNTNFSTLITTTLQNLPGDIFDNVVTNNAALYLLQKKGNVKIVSGGRQFTQALIYAANNTFQARGKYDTIATTIQDNATRSTWDIKNVNGSVAISDIEIAMNAGDKEKLIDLAEEKKQEAEIAMTEVMGDQIFNTSFGANDLDSIPKIISTTVSVDTNSVGGIDSSASGQDYWRNYVHASAVTGFGTSQEGLTKMDLTLNGCTFGRMGPKAIITTKAIFSLYQVALTQNARYSDMELGDAGFKNLQYATLPVMFDDNCVADRMYFIDTDSLKLQILAQQNMKSTGFMQSHTQLIQIMLMNVSCNLTCGSRRTQGVLRITG